jgi:hypothetical protein
MADPTVKLISVPLSKEDGESAWLITGKCHPLWPTHFAMLIAPCSLAKWLNHNKENGKKHDVEDIQVKVDGYDGDKGPFFARIEMTTNENVVLHYFCSDKREPAQSTTEALHLLSNVVVEGNPGGPETLRSA